MNKRIIKRAKKLISEAIRHKDYIFMVFAAGFIFVGISLIWITTISLPNLENFEERRVAQSTKIYDRTGEIILFDVHGDIKRTVVSLDKISDYLEQATIAVEDKDFYEHNGIQISAIIRAIRNNFFAGDLLGGQGGSTITQQVIKNALLTTDKKISRKIKEWVLAPRLENILTKDQILEIYLNEVPYGGTVYGIQEASLRFFGKEAKDLDLAESAYLAGLPQAPTYYSPYGNNLESLEFRKNHVLTQMEQVGFISKTEMEEAMKQEVNFQKQEEFGIKAPHFVMYIREQLEREYGQDVVEEGGLRVITSLDWELQEQAEEIVNRYALENKEKFNAENGAIVATDPKSGEVLVMVGSRDYFDEEIDGNFNIATAERQPGSSFKPFVYAEAFNKGYRPETVVFDLKTEFSAICANGGSCYSPGNYDNIFRGPMTLRDALAQSVNIPAVKALYLAGLRDSLNLAKRMGLETLTNVDQYGLTLVLGGGEVTPLNMSLAYGIFAADGLKYEEKTILRIEDSNGNILFGDKEKDDGEQKNTIGERVLSEQTSRLISDVLSDNVARTPAFGSNSFLNFPGRDVASKTGTTNDYRDAWIVGYTPNISVSAWAGNNDNSAMEKKVAGFIIAPMWNEFMQIAIAKREVETFTNPEPIDPNIKPMIAGFWKGEETSVVEDDDGNKQIVVTGKTDGIHSILHYVNKSNPLGAIPSNPNSDPQYNMWESAVSRWMNGQDIDDDFEIRDVDDVESVTLKIISPENNEEYLPDSPLVIVVEMSDGRKIMDGEVFVNNQKFGDIDPVGNSFFFFPNEVSGLESNNDLKVIIRDELGNSFQKEIKFKVK